MSGTTYKQFIKDARREYFIALLEANEGNVTRAARAAGLNRSDLHKHLARHGLKGKGTKIGAFRKRRSAKAG